MRKREGAAPELLMIERTGAMAFAAGALVFPGGRIDAEDEEAAASFPDVDDAAFRLAAIRETIEETGISPAIVPAPDAEQSTALREGIRAHAAFLPLLQSLGLKVDLPALTPFARWCPSFREARRFDAIFYLTGAPAEAAEPVAQPGEAERAFWASASDVLGEIEAGRAKAIFPTRRNLERLATFSSLAEARAQAEHFPVRTITPWVEERGGERYLCIPDDAGYPVTAEPLETARRM